MAILDADKEGFLRSAWSLIQVVGRAARNVGGEVVHVRRPGDRVDAGGDRRDGSPAAHPTGVQRASTASCRRPSSRASATSTTGCARWPRRAAPTQAGGRARELSRCRATRSPSWSARWRRRCAPPPGSSSSSAPPRCATRSSDIRLRVLEEDASVVVERAAERAAEADMKTPTAKPSERAAAMRSGARRGRRAHSAGAEPALEVTSVTVLPARDEPDETLDGQSGQLTKARRPIGCRASATNTRETTPAGWRAGSTARRGIARVTPNVIKRTGERPSGRRRRYR